tara:strand:- start:187 stop:366 length:180 start_codon:yes stop_codon:yes gene_type:complete
MKSTRYKEPIIATNIKTGETIEFVSVSVACKEFGFKHSGITNCTKGLFKQHHGHTFRVK